MKKFENPHLQSEYEVLVRKDEPKVAPSHSIPNLRIVVDAADELANKLKAPTNKRLLRVRPRSIFLLGPLVKAQDIIEDGWDVLPASTADADSRMDSSGPRDGLMLGESGGLYIYGGIPNCRRTDLGVLVLGPITPELTYRDFELAGAAIMDPSQAVKSLAKFAFKAT